MSLTTTLHRPHALPAVVEVGDSWQPPNRAVEAGGLHAMVAVAGRAGRAVPADVYDAVVGFADDAGRSGALLVRGVPVGELGRTPDHPTQATSKDSVSEMNLLTVARLLGQPVGYLPEHGGDLVQNIVPVRASEQRQVSTSSKVELMFHTEAAFHPHRPHYLLLLCLRGDRDGVARTTLASVREVAPLLDPVTRDVLAQPRFRTAIDESYLAGGRSCLGEPAPVLYGDPSHPHVLFDADLMVGTDLQAQRALDQLSTVVAAHHTGVVLESGDMLIIDNTVAVHGRSPFTPRFDGFDRWLQRTFVVSDLSSSAGQRCGRIVTTHFSARETCPEKLAPR